MSNDKDTEKEICNIINMNKDACSFYESAQDKVENPNLESTFKSLEALHKRVIINLQKHIDDQDQTDETFVGKSQQMWGELKANISNDVDESLIKSLEEAEDRCLHSIQDAMENEKVDLQVRASLKSEHDMLRSSHDYMKQMKDNIKAA